MQSIRSLRRGAARGERGAACGERGAERGERTASRGERGATATEYIIILVLIAVAAIAVWNQFGSRIREKVRGSTAAVEGLDLEPAE